MGLKRRRNFVPVLSGVPEQARAQFPDFLFQDVLESFRPCRRAQIPRSSFPSALRLHHVSQQPAWRGLGLLMRRPSSFRGVGGGPWGLNKASFLALGGSGCRSQDPRLPQAGRKACVRLETNPTNPGYSPTPNEILGGLFCGVRVLLRVGDQGRPPSTPSELSRRNAEARALRGSRERRVKGAGSCRRRADAGVLGDCSNFYPEAGG